MLQLLLLGFLTAGKRWSLRLQCPDLSMEQAKDSDGNQMYGDYEVQQTRENQDQNPRDQRHKGRECNKHTKATGTFRLSGKQTVRTREIFESSVLPRSTGKRAFAALAYANSAKHSFKGVLSYASIPPSKY